VPTTTFNSGAVAGKVTVTADHSTLLVDNNDVVFFQAAISGNATPITFTISGPGAIIAVDSGSMGMESFRDHHGLGTRTKEWPMRSSRRLVLAPSR